MKREFKVGDHVQWNSEAGQVRGTIKRKISSPMKFKTYTVRASKAEPQYLIESDRTDHLAVHKASALHHVRPQGKKRRMRPVHPIGWGGLNARHEPINGGDSTGRARKRALTTRGAVP